MPYVAKDFAFLLGMAGFSDTLLKIISPSTRATSPTPIRLWNCWRPGKRRQGRHAGICRTEAPSGWEFNGMRLHELYFANLGGDGDMAKAPNLMKKKTEQFGAVETCAKDFKATASMRGIGWVILYQDVDSGLLFNQWINEHDVGHPAGCNPLLVLDVFEHAFITDYGLKRADYIGAFFKNVKWDVVEKRLR